METKTTYDDEGVINGISFDYTHEEQEQNIKLLRGEILPLKTICMNHAVDCGVCDCLTTVLYRNNRLKKMVCLSCLDFSDRRKIGKLIKE